MSKLTTKELEAIVRTLKLEFDKKQAELVANIDTNSQEFKDATSFIDDLVLLDHQRREIESAINTILEEKDLGRFFMNNIKNDSKKIKLDIFKKP